MRLCAGLTEAKRLLGGHYRMHRETAAIHPAPADAAPKPGDALLFVGLCLRHCRADDLPARATGVRGASRGRERAPSRRVACRCTP